MEPSDTEGVSTSSQPLNREAKASKGRRNSDPRWDGVEVANLYKVVCRETDTEADRLKVLDRAQRAIVKTGRWKEWEAVKRPTGQIIGYRKLRDGDWFVVDNNGCFEGPFKTKRLCLAKLRVKSATKIDSGIYQAGDNRICTRARLDDVLSSDED
jgi:hypothetical protein